MSYIWENYHIDKFYELASGAFSPYVEILQDLKKYARVNILYRFLELYNLTAKEEGMDYNLLFHLLANIDFYSGITKKDVWMMKTRDEIEEYGGKSSLFNVLMPEHQYVILSYLYICAKEQNKYCRFFDFLTEILDVVLYYVEYSDTYIIYIKCHKDMKFVGKKEYTAGQLYELAKELFCDFWLKVEDYWNIPIGIVGDEIEIDNFQII